MLQDQLKEKEAQLLKLQNDFNSYKQESKELEEFLEEEIREKDKQILQLQQQRPGQVNENSNDDYQLQIEQLQDELKNERDRYEQLEFELTWEKEKQVEKSDSLALLSEIQQFKDEILKYKEQIATLTDQNNAHLQTIQKSNIKSKEHDNNVQQLLDEISTLKKQKNELLMMASDMPELMAEEVQKVNQSQLDDLQKINDLLRHQLSQQKQELNEANQLLDLQIEENKNIIQQMEKKQEEFKRTMDDQLEKTEVLQQEYNLLIEETQNYKQKLIVYETDFKLQQQEFQKLQDNQKLIGIEQQDYMQQINQLKEEVKQLSHAKQLLENKLSLQNDQSNQILILKQKNSNLEKQVEELEEEINTNEQDLKQQLDEKIKTEAQLQEKYKLLEEQLNDMINKQPEANAALELEIEDLKELISKLAIENASVKEQNSQLSNAQQSIDELVLGSQQIINQLNKELEDLRDKCNQTEELECQIRYLEENQNLILERNQILENEIYELRQLDKQDVNQITILQQSLQEAQARISHLDLKLKDYQIEKETKTQQCEILHNQVELLKQSSDQGNSHSEKYKAVFEELIQVKTESAQLKNNLERQIFILNQDLIQSRSLEQEIEQLSINLESQNYQQDNSRNKSIQMIYQLFGQLHQSLKECLLAIDLNENEFKSLQLQYQNSLQQITVVQQELKQKESELLLISQKSVRKSLFASSQEQQEELKNQLDSLRQKYESLTLLKQKQDIQTTRNEQIKYLEEENLALKEEIRQLITESQQPLSQFVLPKSVQDQESQILKLEIIPQDQYLQPRKSKREEQASIQTSKRNSNNYQLMYIHKQQECDLKQQEIQNLKEQLNNVQDELERVHSLLTENSQKVTLKQIFTERHQELLAQMEKLKSEHKKELSQLKTTIVQQQIKLDVLSHFSSENLRLRKQIAVIQSPAESPLKLYSPQKVLQHLKQAAQSPVKHDLFERKKTIADVKPQGPREQKDSLYKLNDDLSRRQAQLKQQLNTISCQVEQLTTDVLVKKNVLMNSESISRKQILSYLDKFIQTLKFLHRRSSTDESLL